MFKKIYLIGILCFMNNASIYSMENVRLIGGPPPRAQTQLPPALIRLNDMITAAITYSQTVFTTVGIFNMALDVPFFEKNYMDFSKQEYELLVRISLLAAIVLFHLKTVRQLRGYIAGQLGCTLALFVAVKMPRVLVNFLDAYLSKEQWRIAGASAAMLPLLLASFMILEWSGVCFRTDL